MKKIYADILDFAHGMDKSMYYQMRLSFTDYIHQDFVSIIDYNIEPQ